MTDPILSHSVEMIAITLAMIFVILGLAFFIKKFNLHKFSPQRGFEIVSQQNIGVREKICLIHFSGKNLLIGVAAGGITLLAEGTAQNMQEPSRGFDSILQKEKVSQ